MLFPRLTHFLRFIPVGQYVQDMLNKLLGAGSQKTGLAREHLKADATRVTGHHRLGLPQRFRNRQPKPLPYGLLYNHIRLRLDGVYRDIVP